MNEILDYESFMCTELIANVYCIKCSRLRYKTNLIYNFARQ